MKIVCILVLFLFSVPLSAECPPGDLTEDCRVDLADFAIFAAHWLNEEIPAPVSYISSVADSPHRSTIGIPDRTVLYEDLFDSNTAFTVALNGTASADTTNYMISADSTPRATKWTAPAAQTSTLLSTTATGFAPKNFANMSFGLRYYLTTTTGLGTIKIIFGSSADFANSRTFTILDSVNSRHFKAGWLDYTGTMSAGAYTDTGAFDPTNIVRVGIYVNKQWVPEIVTTFDYFRVWDGRLKMPLYCCTFDDMYSSQYAMAVYAISKGVPVTIFVCGSRSSQGFSVTNTDGLTMEQLKRLREAGHLIANHTWSHLADWYNWSTDLDLLEREIVQNAEWMYENGFGDGARIFGAPYESFSTGYDRRFRKHYDLNRFGAGMGGRPARGLTTLWDVNSEVRTCGDTNITIANEGIVANVGTPENNYSDGDKAIQITVWHNMGGGGQPTVAEFKAHIDAVAAHVAARRLRAVTLADLLQPMEAMGDN
jgi:peptidoglycan/xylan/chitin deacetylase (PgdA/CDA1 family)